VLVKKTKCVYVCANHGKRECVLKIQICVSVSKWKGVRMIMERVKETGFKTVEKENLL
jgi:hypothetical protein